MRLATVRNSALFSVLGLTSAQSSASTWAQTQPFNVDVSTDSLLGSSQQALTNIVGTNTPSTTLPPAISVTDSFSVSIPTELSTVSQGSGTSVVTVTPSSGASSASASRSAGSSRSASASAASSSAAVIPSGAAAPAGVGAEQKVMGVAGVLAGVAGVLLV